MLTLVSDDAQLERHSFVDVKPVEFLVHEVRYLRSSWKTQDQTRCSSENRLKLSEQATWCVGQDAVAIIQATMDERTDERMHRVLWE